jgi:hypothetical protein
LDIRQSMQAEPSQAVETVEVRAEVTEVDSAAVDWAAAAKNKL